MTDRRKQSRDGTRNPAQPDRRQDHEFRKRFEAETATTHGWSAGGQFGFKEGMRAVIRWKEARDDER